MKKMKQLLGIISTTALFITTTVYAADLEFKKVSSDKTETNQIGTDELLSNSSNVKFKSSDILKALGVAKKSESFDTDIQKSVGKYDTDIATQIENTDTEKTVDIIQTSINSKEINKKKAGLAAIQSIGSSASKFDSSFTELAEIAEKALNLLDKSSDAINSAKKIKGLFK